MTGNRRTAAEAAVSAVLAFGVSLIVFGPILGRIDVGWGGGDMLSTYVNSANWNGFAYDVSTQFGFPLGMNLNYFPGIDITENTFALIANAVTGSTFLGINLLIVLSFPLVAALAYLTIRLTGLQGPLAICLAIAFTFIPFHWGRALGHTYLSTLYSAVVGLALVLLVGSGTFERLLRTGPRGRRIGFAIAVAVMVLTVAWTGIYYVAFTLILGAAALLWRWAQRTSWRSLLLDAVPFAGIGVLSGLAFLPALLTLRGDPPLASLGERLPYESVTFAGNLAVALLPLPQSSLPGFDFYNRSVVEAIGAAPYGESSVITNHGTWITTAAVLVLVGALVLQRRRSVRPPESTMRVTVGFTAYLITVTVLFFVPWGLNYLFAGTVTAQIRAWNRLLPFLLLLFLVGAAAALRHTPAARRLVLALPIGLGIVGLTALDSVLPFRQAYADSVNRAAAMTYAARDYAADVNKAIPAHCGILQLPYLAYPEQGTVGDIGDYDQFWTSISNPGKDWSYGSVKFTDASVWASQLPQVPTDEQVDLLRQAGFCGIHIDTRGYISEELAPILDNLATRFSAPVATGADGAWLLYAIGDGSSATGGTVPEVQAFLHQPFIEADPETTSERDSALEHLWWWTESMQATFILTPTSADAPLTSVSGSIASPPCGPLPVTVSLTAGGQSTSATVIAEPDVGAPFTLTLATPASAPALLTVDAPGLGCPVKGSDSLHFAQVLDLTTR